jgi:NAD+ synthase
MNQSEIVAEMKVLPEIDVEYEVRRRVDFIKYELELSGQKALVLGISGGVDSCTCGRLAQLAVDELNAAGSGYRFVAVRLPYADQADEADAQLSLDFIQPSHSVTVNVQAGTDAIHQTTLAALQEQRLADQSESTQDFYKGNVKARMRMIAQYEIAGLLGGLVLGTDHSAENVTGFYTKYGDGACDIVPLFGLNKRQVSGRARQDHHQNTDRRSRNPGPLETRRRRARPDLRPDRRLPRRQENRPRSRTPPDPHLPDHRAQAPTNRHRLRSVVLLDNLPSNRQPKRPFATDRMACGSLKKAKNFGARRYATSMSRIALP